MLQIQFASQMWAARPHLANIFEKLLDQKTFGCLRLVLGKPLAYGSARLGHILSLPWESQLPLKPCILIAASRLKRQLRFFRFTLRFLFSFIVQFCYLLRKCGLLAHTSPTFLKNCWIKKLFGCLRLIVCSQHYLAKTLTTTEKCSIIQVSSLLPRKKGFLSFMKLFRELYHYREMLFSLVRKDLRGRYKGSVLGFLWTFINPLMQLLVYTFVFTVILPAQVEHYSLYLFVALIPWIFFSAAMTGGAGSIVAQKDLVKKIYFPREIIPISYVTSCFVNMLLCFLIIFLVMLVTGATFNLLAFLCLPIIMVVEYLLALGIAMLSAAITVYFRDLEHILGIVSMIWMYMTPVLYPETLVPERFQKLYHLNPMTSIITAYRDVLYRGVVPQLSTLLEAVILGILFLAVGLLTFSKLKKGFAEEL